MKTIGTIKMSVLYNVNKPFQPWPARDYLLQHDEEKNKYFLGGHEIHSCEVLYLFWIENASHAYYGVDFIMDIIDGNIKSSNQGCKWSCGEGLKLEYTPI